MLNTLTRFTQSPANWCGLGLGTLALLLSGSGLALWGGVGGSLGLLAALVLLGRDGKMLGYGLMLLVVALPQWALQIKGQK